MGLSPVELQIIVRLSAGLTQSQIGVDLGIEQSAISKILRAAETKLGLRLTEQSGRRVVLTAPGRELARAAEHALGQLEALDGLVISLREGHAGRVTVLASTTPGSYVLPQIVGAFLREFPEARVALEIESHARIIEAFATGTYDMALAAQMALPDDLVAEPVYEDRLLMFAAPGSPLAARNPVEFEELEDVPLVARFVDTFWEQIMTSLARRGVRRTNQVHLRSSEAVKRMVAAGFGVGVLFESSIRSELDEGLLVEVRLREEPWLGERFSLLRRRDVPLSPIARQFYDFAKAQLRDRIRSFHAGAS